MAFFPEDMIMSTGAKNKTKLDSQECSLMNSDTDTTGKQQKLSLAVKRV